MSPISLNSLPAGVLPSSSAAVKKSTSGEYHGGQEWQHLDGFIEDFSVTTNGLGTPLAALEAAREAMMHILHYPPLDQEPAFSSLARFLSEEEKAEEQTPQIKEKLLLGNGASELIDLIIRCSPEGAWSPGTSLVQYKEYQRSAQIQGRPIRLLTDRESSVKVTCCSLVNPTNPTGEYWSLPQMKDWIEEHVPEGCTLTVDESMQPWLGPMWRQDSLVSQSEWIQSQWSRRRVSIYVIHSWTKLWSCPGLRLGSVICPTFEHALQLRRLQVPWSVNGPALSFLQAVLQDSNYLKQTWTCTSEWRAYAVTALEALSQKKNKAWTVRGASWISWMWLEMRDEALAERAVKLAKQAGVPVRWAKYGYEQPLFVRVAVRSPALTDRLLEAWQSL